MPGYLILPGSGNATAASRPAADANTLIDFRFNETNQVACVNHGSWGTLAAPIGPLPTTTNGNFTQPAVGSTVAVTFASGTNYAVGNLIYIVGGGYYYCTAASSPTFTLKNLGTTGNAAATTVINSGAAVSAKLDLLNYDVGVHSVEGGLYDWCDAFYGADTGSISNYNVGGTGGGIGQFTGITKFSMHALVYLPAAPTAKDSQTFGYSHAQAWGSTFRDVGLYILHDTTGAGQWGILLSNQSFTTTPSLPAANASSYLTAGVWTLLSVTVDLTLTTNAITFYKNGVASGTANISATGSLAMGSAGYWYVGNPNLLGGDTGDATNGLIALARFDNVVRTQAQIQAMWNAIEPASAAWPVS